VFEGFDSVFGALDEDSEKGRVNREEALDSVFGDGLELLEA
jgi:hypothetical protein